MGQVVVVGFSQKPQTELEKKTKKALKKIGMIAETYAKQLAPVDTGLLANSITYALGGDAPAIGEYMDNAGEQIGLYEGSAPADDDSQTTLYVGTNVNYAIYQELGHHTTNGNWVPPQEFLRPAVEGHMEEYMNILDSELKM